MIANIRRLICLVTLALPLSAQEPAANPRAVQPERPTVATHAYTVAPGYVEIEAGLQGDRVAPGSRAYGAPIVLKLGLSRRTQLNVTTPIAVASSGRAGGLGDVAVGLKWRVLDSAPLLGDFALLPALKLPSGSAQRGIGSGSTDIGIMAISSHHFGAVAMDLNAGYTRVGRSDAAPASDAALWTASFGYPLAGRLSAVTELFGAPTIDGSGRSSTVALLVGPTFLVSPALNLDAGVIAPLHGGLANAIYAGLVWNMGRLSLPTRFQATPARR